jgi:hypothetical protein
MVAGAVQGGVGAITPTHTRPIRITAAATAQCGSARHTVGVGVVFGSADKAKRRPSKALQFEPQGSRAPLGRCPSVELWIWG